MKEKDTNCSSVGGILIRYLGFRVLMSLIINGYRLTKVKDDFTTKDSSYVNESPKREEVREEINDDEYSSFVYKNDINKFISVLKEEFPKEYLGNFYNNINQVTFKKNFWGLLFQKVLGKYDAKKNRVTTISDYELYHELLHLASTYFDEKNKEKMKKAQDGEVISYFIGFLQVHYTKKVIFGKLYKTKRRIFGRALNEGYTDLLSNRHFHRPNSSYNFLRTMATYVENVVGKEEMEEAYFKADLPRLIEDLKKYASEEEVYSFITSLDALLRNQGNLLLFRNKYVKKSVLTIYSFLLKTNQKKLKEDLENNIIDEITYRQKLKDLESLISGKVNYNLVSYDKVTKEDKAKIKELLAA